MYGDTSVFGGCLDEEFWLESVSFFAEIRSGRFVPVISGVTLDEPGLAPEEIRRVLAGMPPSQTESRELQQAYLDAGVVGSASTNDAAPLAGWKKSRPVSITPTTHPGAAAHNLRGFFHLDESENGLLAVREAGGRSSLIDREGGRHQPRCQR